MLRSEIVITITPIEIEGIIFTAIQIELPNTNIFMISNEIGYIIGSALNINLDQVNKSNRIIAANVLYANKIDDLLYQPLMAVTEFSNQFYGWEKGMLGKEALLLIA